MLVKNQLYFKNINVINDKENFKTTNILRLKDAMDVTSKCKIWSQSKFCTGGKKFSIDIYLINWQNWKMTGRLD